MESLRTIVGFLDRFLHVAAIPDASFNGLQFEGAPQVRRVLCAVDAGAETFARAAAEKAQLVIVHHGQFWSGLDPRFCGPNKKRLDILYHNDISLYAAHLPLDLHGTAGNNAQLIRLVGARKKEPFAFYEGRNISFTATFAKPPTLAAVEKRLAGGLSTTCVTLPFGPPKIRTVGVVSGSCSHAHLNEAVARGLDLFITGERKDFYHTAKDAGINVIFAGHHASETVGVAALAEALAKKFRVKTRFVDIPTGL